MARTFDPVTGPVSRLGPAFVRWTGAAEGDLGHRPATLPHDDRCCDADAVARRRAVRPGDWVRVHQVHGAEVLVADGTSAGGAPADAIVTAAPGITLAIATADCAPIALASPEGVIGAVHAGWPGLRAGVIGAAVATMRELGAAEVRAALGPCIHAECYEFMGPELDELVARWGEGVRSTTAQGTPALDVPAAVAAALAVEGVELEHVDPRCTACSGEHFSYRRTGTSSRQVMLVWREPADDREGRSSA